MLHKPTFTLSVTVGITTAILHHADLSSFGHGLPRAREIHVPKSLSLPHLEHTIGLCI
jgi:hypothetical protein